MHKLFLSLLLLLTLLLPLYGKAEGQVKTVWYNTEGGKKFHRIGICHTIDQQYWHAMASLDESRAREMGLEQCAVCFADDYLYDQFIRSVEHAEALSLDEEKILMYADAYLNTLIAMDDYTLTHPDYNYRFEAEFFASRTEEELFGWEWRCALVPKDALQWRQVLLLGYAYLDQVCHVRKDRLGYYFSDPMYQILLSGEQRWRIGMQVALHYHGGLSIPHDSYDIYIDPKDAHLLSLEAH